MTPRIFRALILTTVALGIFGSLFDAIFPTALPVAFVQAQEAQDSLLSTPSVLLGGMGALVLLVIGVASTVGLYQFRPWAPRLAVIATVLALLLAPLLGASACSGYAMALHEMSSMLWGAVVALAYFSPLRDCFVRTDH